MKMFASRRAFLAGLLATPAVLGVAGKTHAAITMPPPIQPSRPYIGAAVRIDQIRADTRLAEAVLRDCSSLTAEIDMKWDALQPQAEVWRTGPADGLVEFAGQHGKKVRGHALLWDQSTPEWVRSQLRRTPGDWSIVARYFEAVIGRYGGAVDEWDVINEPIDTEGGEQGLRKSVFHTAYGPSYIDRALHEARRHAPAARLAINEYGLEYGNPVDEARRAALLKLVRRLKQDDVPIDMVGIQAHLDLSKGPVAHAAVADFFSALADLGLKIAITEMDVKEERTQGDVTMRDQAVADHVRSYLDVVLDQPAVTGVTTWGLGDHQSWLQNQPVRADVNPGRLNRGLPYDANLRPKPVYWTLHQAMSDAELATITTR